MAKKIWNLYDAFRQKLNSDFNQDCCPILTYYSNKHDLTDLAKVQRCLSYKLIPNHIFDIQRLQRLNFNYTEDHTKLQIEEMKESDMTSCLSLFENTVRNINCRDYTAIQIQAWLSPKRTLESWKTSFINHKCFVAKLNSTIVGFADVDEDGYLDRFYVHYLYQSNGVGKALLNTIIHWAKEKGLPTLTTHASITAKPFFEHFGFQTIKKQEVIRNNISLTNFVMKKGL